MLEHGRLVKALYRKLTDKLHYDSHHPINCKKPIISGQSTCLRRICANYSDYKVKLVSFSSACVTVMNFKRIPPHQICRPTLSAAWSFQICGFRVLLALFVAGFRFLFLDSSYGERCTTKWGASTEFYTMSVSLTSHKSSFTIFIDDVVFVVLVYTAGCVSDVRLQLNNLL